MSSYFSHFLVIQIYSYLTDSLIMLISIFIIIGLMSIRKVLLPSRIIVLQDYLMNHWLQIIVENLKKNYSYFSYPIIALFFYILLINFSGFHLFVHPVTTHVNITLGVAWSAWMSIYLYGFYKHRSLFLSTLMPHGAPLMLSPLLVLIEILSNLSKPLALGLRIAANLTAGHVLLSILSDFNMKLMVLPYTFISFFPLIILLGIIILEMGVLVIQAYVFCLLLIIYLKDSIILH